MEIVVSSLPVTKRHALTISRGTSAASNNVLVAVTQDGVTGLGEFSPVGQCTPPENATTATAQLTALAELLKDVSPWEMQKVETLADETATGRAALCALDMALYDWVGKRTNTPVWKLLGGDPSRIVPTSVTVGILPPAEAADRVREWLSWYPDVRSLKIKLGSPAGIDADQAMFAAVQEATPDGIPLRVDANGGWKTVQDARAMMTWLAGRGVEYVEQPFAKGCEDDLPALFAGRPCPIFADESCAVASDVTRLADRVDGVNLKLLKAGGIRAGLRLIHTARAHGLQVMMGCMSESSLAIAASVAISPYADHLDLDSQLNLSPDPFSGLVWSEGRVLPSDAPGLGVAAQR